MKNSRSFPRPRFSAALVFLLFSLGFSSAHASQELKTTTSNVNTAEMMQGVSESNSFDKGKKSKKKKKKKHRCEAMGG